MEMASKVGGLRENELQHGGGRGAYEHDGEGEISAGGFLRLLPAARPAYIQTAKVNGKLDKALISDSSFALEKNPEYRLSSI